MHSELLNENETVNVDRYCSQLDVLNIEIQRKHTILANRRGKFIQHDNARPHVARQNSQKIAKFGWETLPISLPFPPKTKTSFPGD